LPKEVQHTTGHRARLRESFLLRKLTDQELLELLLTYAIPRVDVKPIAFALLKKFGGIHHVFAAPINLLSTVRGVGHNTAVFIKAVQSVMLTDLKNALDAAPVFREYKNLEDYCRLMLAGAQTEEFHVMYLNSDFRLIVDDLHSSGTIDWAAVYPREIIKRALDLNAAALILLHNHPAASNAFSSDDIRITNDIRGMLEMVGIELLDHLLVAGGIVYSAKNMFLLK